MEVGMYRFQEALAHERLILSDAEAIRLAAILDRGFNPSPALRNALENLANSKRRPPKLHWKKVAKGGQKR
jgi:hypothetical protein